MGKESLKQADKEVLWTLLVYNHCDTTTWSILSLLSPNLANFAVNKLLTVKSFNFMGSKFCGLTTMDKFVDTWIRELYIIICCTKSISAHDFLNTLCNKSSLSLVLITHGVKTHIFGLFFFWFKSNLIITRVCLFSCKLAYLSILN